MEFSKKERIIIDILEEFGPKAYTELKQVSNGELDNDSTLSRALKNLNSYNFIEKFLDEKTKSKYREKYRLTKKYFKLQKEKESKSQFSKIISSRMYLQSTLNQMNYYLELKYPILTQRSKFINFNEIIFDLLSYLIHFDIFKHKIPKNFQLYFDLMLYLILNHPDDKYFEIYDFIQIDFNKFQEELKSFIENKKLEKFSFKHPKTSKQTFFYLISDDPILYHIKQNIETSFSKFLISWQFPNIKLEDHFDFFLQFSNNIFVDLKSKYKPIENESILFHLKNNKICFLIFIREYVLEQLKKVQIQNVEEIINSEIPLKLLTIEQKERFRSELITSPQILTSNDKKNLEIYYSLNIENFEMIASHIKDLSKELNLLISKPKKSKKIVYLKSHLIFLIRIFYNLSKQRFNMLRQELSKKFKEINFKYSKLSDEIFNSIVKFSIGLKKESDFNKRYFTTYQFLERIDHLINKLKKEKNNKDEIKRKIYDIFEIISSSFREKNRYPFLKKQCEIFLQGFDLFSESEVKSILTYLIEKYPMNRDVGDLLIGYIIKTNNITEFEDLYFSNNWNISDKIYLFKKYIYEVPLEFDIALFFNLEFETLLNNFNILYENDRNDLIILLKIFGIFYERQEDYTNSFILYYLATELEQVALNPLIKNIIYKIFPRINNKNELLRLENPAYLSLLRIFEKYRGNLEFKSNNLTPISAMFFKFLFNINIDEKIEIINNSMPILIRALKCLFNFFKIKIDNEKQDKNKEVIIKFRFIEESDKLTVEDKEILRKAKNFLEEFLKNSSMSFLWGTSANIHFTLNPLKDLDMLTKDTDYNSKQSLLEQISSYEIFTKSFYYDQNNHFIPIINSIQDLKEYYSGILTLPLSFYNIIQKKYDPEFFFINSYFGLPFEDMNYSFNLSFKRLYKNPINKPLDFWDRLITQLESDPLQLIELLDIFMYLSRNFSDFEKLERLSFLILKSYGINWALRYIDTFKEYIKWYNERLELPLTKLYPYTLDLESLFDYIDFHINIIKANLYWEYRDRNKTQDYINLAYKNLEIMNNRDIKLMGCFLTFQQKLIELYNKMNQ